VQVSALGADADAQTRYHQSKRAADDHLLSLPLDATVVQPSLVFGRDDVSSRAMLAWASLPLVPLPAGGTQRMQPVHVADVVEAIMALLQAQSPGRGQRVALVGPAPMTLHDYLRALRTGLGQSTWRTCSVPAPWVATAARLFERWPRAPFDRAAWQTLQRGQVADPAALAGLLGRAPRPAEQFIEPAIADAVRRQVRLGWLLPLVR